MRLARHDVFGGKGMTVPNCILEPEQAKAKAVAQQMGWPMWDGGMCIRVNLPEDWADEIVERTGVDLETVPDFVAAIRRTRNVEDIRRRIETRGLLG